MRFGDWSRRRVFIPFWSWKDGSQLPRFLAEAERNQQLHADELRALQWERLTRLLAHAHRNVPYYREVFDQLGATPADLSGWRDFARLPVLRKRTIQERLADLTARSVPEGDRLLENRTGGSTGEPLRFFTTQRRAERASASTIRHNRWTGWEVGESMAVLWGSQLDLASLRGIRQALRHRLLDGSVFLNTATLTRASLEAFARTVARRKLSTWLGYANSLALFARFAAETRAPGLAPRAILTSAELLTAETRSLLESTFGCPVFDRYGCREVSVIASECGRTADHALHLNADALYVEVAAAPGAPGRVLITDLLNYGTPFVRYQIEDVAALTGGACPCGRTLPLLTPVAGRTTDFLVTGGGRVVSGAALTIKLLTELPGVRRGQFVQERRGEVLFRILPGPDHDADTERLALEACRRCFGADTKVEIEIVDAIEAGPSGKMPFSISKVDPFEALG